MFKYVFQNIRFRWIKTALTVLGIAACISLFSVISSILQFTISDLEAQMMKYVGQMYVHQVGQETMFPPVNAFLGEETAHMILER